MNRTVDINLSLGDKTFNSSFPIGKNIKEEQIDDEAYRLSLMFVNTEIFARYGNRIPTNAFETLWKELSYSYTIKEV